VNADGNFNGFINGGEHLHQAASNHKEK
jgi:hypothetical protein